MKLTFHDLEYAGRLGNQLFQIAGTVGMAQTRHMQPAFPTRWSYRPFFSVPDSYFSDEPGLPAQMIAPELVGMVDERHRIYLQDVRLWDSPRAKYDAHSMFQPSAVAAETLYDSSLAWFHGFKRKISLHVRRGDNTEPGKEAYYPMPTLDYYQRAIAQIDRTDLPIIVFSDDIAWCRDVLPDALPGRKLYFYDKGRARKKESEPGYMSEPVIDWIELFLMAMCDRHVISNSTYAWWGAWLSNDDAPIYPSVWWGPKILEYADPTLLFLDQRWKKVEV